MTDSMHPQDDTPPWLDHALARNLVPPPTPAGLASRVQATARADRLQSLQQRHTLLQAELAQARQRLAQRETIGGLQTLGLAVVVAFASGALAALTLPQWSPWLGEQAPLVLPLLALGLGIATGGLAVRMR